MLFKLANLIMGGTKFLGAITDKSNDDYADAAKTVAKTVSGIVQSILVPILSVVGAAGIIWAIVLGINFARADSNDKREEAKKRLISLIVGIVVVVALMLFFLFGFEKLLEAFGVNGIDVQGTNE